MPRKTLYSDAHFHRVTIIGWAICISTHSYLSANQFLCILVKCLQFVLVFDIHPRFSVTYYMSCLFADFTNLNFSWIGDNKSSLCMFMTISHYYYFFLLCFPCWSEHVALVCPIISIYTRIYICVFLLTCPICVRCAYSLPRSLNASLRSAHHR